MVVFLSSPPGLLAVAVAASVLVAILTAGFWHALRPDRSAVDVVGGADANVARPGRLLAALLMAAVMIVPTLFTLASADTFVLPKLTALRLMLVAGLLLLGWSATRTFGAPPSASSAALRSIDPLVIVYVGLTTLATIVSIDPSHSLVGEPQQYQGLLTTLLYVAFFYLARASLGDARRLALLALAATAGGTIVAGYALIQQLRLDPLWSTLDKGRVFSTLGQAEWLAAYLVLCLPMGLALLWQARSVWRLLLAPSLVLIFTALLLTLSRGGYLGIAVAAAVFAMAVARNARPTRRWLLALPPLALVVVLVGAVTPVRQQAEVVLQRALSTVDLTEGSIADRLDLWRVGAAIAVDHPLLGAGPETFPLLFPHYRDTLLADRRAFWLAYRPESPHDTYLATAAGAGIPALASYLALLGAIFIVVGRASQRAPERSTQVMLAAVLAAAAGHLVTDAFMTAEVTGSWLSWLLLGAAVGYAFAAEEAPTRKNAGASDGRTSSVWPT